ncbi:MAG: hypothetical protein GEU76_01860 [Alphaproteobacteria bacterium]|nr:hypothetical protein [Alphaproteobacteria bacterium]
MDSVNERAYQAAFCQLLAAQGYRVLHSTRHMSIEFGKDIIALDKDGIPCAFQLKGNPGSRLTLTQFREIAEQLRELVTQPIVFPGIPNRPHRSFLVTNGMVEEEVQRAIDDFNRGLLRHGYNADQGVRIIARGEFLDWLIQYGSSVWPIEISPLNALLEILVKDGSDPFPLKNLHTILMGLLGLGETKSIRSANILRQRVFAAAVMTTLTLMNFEKRDNHFAIVSAWTLYAVYVHAACSRYRFSIKNGEPAIKIARDAILSSLLRLLREINDRIDKIRKHTPSDQITLFRMAQVEPPAITDFLLLPGRTLLVASLLSLLRMWCEEEGWPSNESFDAEAVLESVLPVPMTGIEFWGEGALPQILVHFWLWRKKDATLWPERAIDHLLRQLLSHATSEGSNGFPSPYYDYEDVIRHVYRPFLPSMPDALERETFTNSSYVAEGLLHLLVRTNLKSSCKINWPEFSRLMLMEFQPEEPWQYCLLNSERGKVVSVQVSPTKEWEALKTDARVISCPSVPTTLLEDKFLLMLFVIIAPHRLTASVIRHLGYKFCDVWFLGEPIQ